MGDEAAMKKLLYRLMSLGLSVVSGMIAGAMFKGAWKLVAREETAKKPTLCYCVIRKILKN